MKTVGDVQNEIFRPRHCERTGGEENIYKADSQELQIIRQLMLIEL